MSLVGLGLDLVAVDRIAAVLARHGDRFLDRVFVAGEVREGAGEGLAQHVAGLFAVKEAVLKALGTGWAQGLGFRDVEVVRGPSGRPEVRLHGAAAQRAESLGGERILVSISHDRGFAAAVAVLESGERSGGRSERG